MELTQVDQAAVELGLMDDARGVNHVHNAERFGPLFEIEQVSGLINADDSTVELIKTCKGRWNDQREVSEFVDKALVNLSLSLREHRCITEEDVLNQLLNRLAFANV